MFAFGAAAVAAGLDLLPDVTVSMGVLFVFETRIEGFVFLVPDLVTIESVLESHRPCASFELSIVLAMTLSQPLIQQDFRIDTVVGRRASTAASLRWKSARDCSSVASCAASARIASPHFVRRSFNESVICCVDRTIRSELLNDSPPSPTRVSAGVSFFLLAVFFVFFSSNIHTHLALFA